MTETSDKIGKFQFKTFEDVQWLKIFHHDCSEGEFFKAGSPELLNINTKNLFSILYMINDRFKINGKYEFLLEYPEENKYNHWRQSVNPLDIIDQYGNGVTTHYYVDGYEKITVQMDSHNWGGLARSNWNYALLEGSLGSPNWYYTIGQSANNWRNSTLAGYEYDDTIHIVHLWIGITYKLLFSLLCTKSHFVLNFTIFLPLLFLTF